MAISIDRVYQKVLAFANKEQRGYITPQEFNLFADQAQMEIFEQYFYDINQWTRQHGNSTGHSDILTNLEEKVSLFERYDQVAGVSNELGDVDMTTGLPNLYRLEMVRVDYQENSGFVVAEEVQLNELNKYGTSPLGIWSKKRPVYTRYTGGINPQALKVYPYPSSDLAVDRVLLSYIQTPLTPNWNYVVVNDKALYNSTTSQDFELHQSEESELVYRILAFAGIAMGKPNLTQSAASLEQAKVQQEKQ
tara:strand:- start:905 stop:1651 length:747 start_codon:yes stop_codon:yes gene_type:complete